MGIVAGAVYPLAVGLAGFLSHDRLARYATIAKLAGRRLGQSGVNDPPQAKRAKGANPSPALRRPCSVPRAIRKLRIALDPGQQCLTMAIWVPHKPADGPTVSPSRIPSSVAPHPRA